MALSWEYSRAYEVREALDSAVRDSVRLLARAPAAMATDPSTGRPFPGLHDFFLNSARQIIEARTGFEMTPENFVAAVSLEQATAIDENGETFSPYRSPYYEVVVQAHVDIDLPLLGLFGWIAAPTDGESAHVVRMMAADSSRYLAEVPLGDDACSILNNFQRRAQGEAECEIF